MNNLTITLSTTLKNLRKKNGWSLDTTSKKTGVSKAMLGQIERGESSPTIGTLWKIATGFEVSFSSFIDDTKTNEYSFIHRNPKFQKIYPNDPNVMPIFPFDEKLGFELFIIKLPPGSTHLAQPHQKGVIEHIIPIQGTIEVFVKGIWHTINQHEGFRFEADLDHGYRNSSDKPSLFHNIIHYSKL